MNELRCQNERTSQIEKRNKLDFTLDLDTVLSSVLQESNTKPLAVAFSMLLILD